MIELAPIALFVYKRLDHTISTIEALRNNFLATQSDLFIFSDAAKAVEDQEDVEKVRSYLNAISGFKSLTVINQLENKGLANSIISGVSSLFERYSKLIVLEDDLKTSPYFLSYMNKALDFYSPENIWSIAGYTPNIPISNQYSYCTYLAHRNCSWGWATWKQNWEKTDWDVEDFQQFYRSKKQREQFERGGNDLSVMLMKQQQGLIDSWSIRFNYSAYKQDLPSVYPVKSLVVNMGVDGSGTNMKVSTKYLSTLEMSARAVGSFCPHNQMVDTIQKAFRKFYNTSVVRWLINHYKYFKYITGY